MYVFLSLSLVNQAYNMPLIFQTNKLTQDIYNDSFLLRKKIFLLSLTLWIKSFIWIFCDQNYPTFICQNEYNSLFLSNQNIKLLGKPLLFHKNFYHASLINLYWFFNLYEKNLKYGINFIFNSFFSYKKNFVTKKGFRF